MIEYCTIKMRSFDKILLSFPKEKQIYLNAELRRICGNQLMFARVKKNVFIMSLLGSFLCFTSCNLWYQDWKGYLEYWSGTVQIGRVEVSGVSITQNDAGVDTISLKSNPTITGYVINPKEYVIDDSIGDLSSDSTVQVTAAVKDSVSFISVEATVLQVRVAATDSSLEHTDFTVNFCPVRQDTGTSVEKTMGVTLRYNTPPRIPIGIVWDGTNFSFPKRNLLWGVTTNTQTDKDGWVYWAWPKDMRVDTGLIDESDPDCVSSFSLNGTNYAASSLLVTGESIISGSTTYDIYGYKIGKTEKLELRALDCEGIAGTALYSGLVPTVVILDGAGGYFYGDSNQTSAELSVQEGASIDKSGLPTPHKDGWIFTGWLDSSGNSYDFSKPVIGEKELVASWSQAIYVNGPAGSDSNYGSAADPVKSMEKALEKIYAANDGTSQYTIYVQADYDTSHASSFGSSLINITPKKTLNLTIQSVDGKIYTINANGKKGVIQIAPTNGTLSLTIENLKLTGGNAVYGGGLYVKGGIVTIQGSTTISGNEATEGGGICLEDGTLTIEPNVLITQNRADAGGGIVLNGQSSPTLENKGKITGNTASIEGGGLAVYTGSYTNSGTISGNSAGVRDPEISE